jgi:hypothetical protein
MIGCEEIAFIEEMVEVSVATSASPGFTWGRSGNVSVGAWLLNESVPSNISGRNVFLSSALIKKVFIAQQDPVIVKYNIYHHVGDGLSLTLVGSVTTTAVRTYEVTVNFSVPKDVQLAVKIADDSPNSAKNPVVGVLIAGTLV